MHIHKCNSLNLETDGALSGDLKPVSNTFKPVNDSMFKATLLYPIQGDILGKRWQNALIM